MEYDYSYRETVKIYDTDAQGIVHYSGYYRFFTDAVEEFMKAKGQGFPILDGEKWMVVLESGAKYLRPAHIGDVLDIFLSISLISKKILRFDFTIKKKDESVCQGYLLHICIDKNKWKSTELPQSFVENLTKKA